MQIVRKVLLPEALPGLVNAALSPLLPWSVIPRWVVQSVPVFRSDWLSVWLHRLQRDGDESVLVLLVILVYLIQFAGDRISGLSLASNVQHNINN